MISDEFVQQLRVVFQAQTSLLRRIRDRVDHAEHYLNGTASQAQRLAELDRLMAEVECNADLLQPEDVPLFDDWYVLQEFHSRSASVQAELQAIGFRDWDSFVCECGAYAVANDLDPLLPYETLLTEADCQTLRSESYESRFRWDRCDYAFVGAAGVLASLTDLLLVRIPHSMKFLGKYDQAGSPLTRWVKDYDPAGRDDFFSRWVKDLEDRCKVPYDAQAACLGGEFARIPGMYPRSHRFQSLGHDSVLGFVFGVVDILRGTITGFSYDKLSGQHAPFAGEVCCNIEPVPLIEAVLGHLGHLISDAFTDMGLPAPLMPLLQMVNGRLTPGGRTLGEIARWMYLNGYDLRHFLVGGLVPAVIEIVLRAYIMLRHYAEHGEISIRLAGNPKYRSMLLGGHAIATVANAGKVALYQGNPLAINAGEWVAFFRYLVPSVKYWLLDRERMKLEHLEQINEGTWNDIERQTARVVETLARANFPTMALGRTNNEAGDSESSMSSTM